jgi:hypothetical protein
VRGPGHAASGGWLSEGTRPREARRRS